MASDAHCNSNGSKSPDPANPKISDLLLMTCRLGTRFCYMVNIYIFPKACRRDTVIHVYLDLCAYKEATNEQARRAIFMMVKKKNFNKTKDRFYISNIPLKPND